MNPLDRIIVDMAHAAMLRNRRLLVAAYPCSGRIHDANAAKCAEVNAMYTETENDGIHQHTPIIRGGCGRSDAEMSEWGETLHAVVKYGLIAGALVVLALVVLEVL